MTDLFGRRFAAVIFDNDQTLIDSTEAIGIAWTQWAIHFGVTKEQFVAVHGTTAQDLAEAMVAPERRAEAVELIVRLETDIVDGVRPLPGAVAALTALREDRRAIATSAVLPVLKARLDAAALPLPRVHVTAEDVVKGKPDPQVFLLAAERLGVRAADCLVCEDAVPGIAAARAAGCASLGVTFSTPAARLDADLVVPDLSRVRFVDEPGGVRVELL